VSAGLGVAQRRPGRWSSSEPDDASLAAATRGGTGLRKDSDLEIAERGRNRELDHGWTLAVADHPPLARVACGDTAARNPDLPADVSAQRRRRRMTTVHPSAA
jgi:hypothetical protein